MKEISLVSEGRREGVWGGVVFVCARGGTSCVTHVNSRGETTPRRHTEARGHAPMPVHNTKKGRYRRNGLFFL